MQQFSNSVETKVSEQEMRELVDRLSHVRGAASVADVAEGLGVPEELVLTMLADIRSSTTKGVVKKATPVDGTLRERELRLYFRFVLSILISIFIFICILVAINANGHPGGAGLPAGVPTNSVPTNNVPTELTKSPDISSKPPSELTK